MGHPSGQGVTRPEKIPHATRTATVRPRLSYPYHHRECPTAELTTNDTDVIAQGRLKLQDPLSNLPQGHSPGQQPEVADTGPSKTLRLPRMSSVQGQPSSVMNSWKSMLPTSDADMMSGMKLMKRLGGGPW